MGEAREHMHGRRAVGLKVMMIDDLEWVSICHVDSRASDNSSSYFT